MLWPHLMATLTFSVVVTVVVLVVLVAGPSSFGVILLLPLESRSSSSLPLEAAATEANPDL